MVLPSYLLNGDKVMLISTARKITLEELSPAISTLKKWGLNPVLGNNLLKEDNQFAGTTQERKADLQQALNQKDIKAVFFVRGGYGTIKTLEGINFSAFVTNPKWLIGYSDVTVLHSHVQQNHEIATLHGTMPINFLDNTPNSLLQLKNVLFGKPVSYVIAPHALNKKGRGTGVLTGGNLSILYSLTGTKSMVDTRGKILFIEDLDEYLYHIDRMMMNLKLSGALSHLQGLVVGGMTKMNDNAVGFGKSAEAIILEAVAEYSFPVCFNFPAGHIDDNNPLVLGKEVKLEVKEGQVELTYV